MVRSLLASLPQSEQELLAFRFAAQLSSAEIAVLIGKSEAATKKQLTRIIRRLREQLRHRELETPLPDLLEPTLPAFVATLFGIYAVSLPTIYEHSVRQSLLALIHPVSS